MVREPGSRPVPQESPTQSGPIDVPPVPRFWTKRKAAVIGGGGVLLMTGAGLAGALMGEPKGGPSQETATPTRITSTTETPTPSIQTEMRFPHELVLERSVCGPIIQAIKAREASPELRVDPGPELSQLTSYTYTHEAHGKRAIISISGVAQGDSLLRTPDDSFSVNASLIELGTGDETRANPTGDRVLAEVNCSRPDEASGERIGATGIADGGVTPFSTLDNTLDPNATSIPIPEAQRVLNEATAASHATIAILEFLPPVQK